MLNQGLVYSGAARRAGRTSIQQQHRNADTYCSRRCPGAASGCCTPLQCGDACDQNHLANGINIHTSQRKGAENCAHDAQVAAPHIGNHRVLYGQFFLPPKVLSILPPIEKNGVTAALVVFEALDLLRRPPGHLEIVRDDTGAFLQLLLQYGPHELHRLGQEICRDHIGR